MNAVSNCARHHNSFTISCRSLHQHCTIVRQTHLCTQHFLLFPIHLLKQHRHTKPNIIFCEPIKRRLNIPPRTPRNSFLMGDNSDDDAGCRFALFREGTTTATTAGDGTGEPYDEKMYSQGVNVVINPENAPTLHQVIEKEVGLSDNDSCENDLRAIANKIGSPFLCEHEHDHDDDGVTNNCLPEGDDKDNTRWSNGCCCIVCITIDLRQRSNLISRHMGNMAQCRGDRGDDLRDAGAISAVLGVLWKLMLPLQLSAHCSLLQQREKYGLSAVDVNSNNCNATKKGLCFFPLLPPVTNTSYVQELGQFSDLQFGSCERHLPLSKENCNMFTKAALNELDSSSLDLAIACLGSLRDLSCGSALSRAAILEWSPRSFKQTEDQINNGIHLLTSYALRYDKLDWEEITSMKERGAATSTIDTESCLISGLNLGETTQQPQMQQYKNRGKRELRLYSNALGAIRNASHSTPDNCREFLNHGLVNLLVWRLMPDCINDTLSNTPSLVNSEDVITTASATPSSSLPDATCPWREASYRAAGSLINLAEKCPAAAYQLGSNRRFIYLLIETWGGAKAIIAPGTSSSSSKNIPSSKSMKGVPLLSLGLAAILHAAADGALEGGLDEVMIQVLEKEKIRKRVAQRKEEERKVRLGYKKQ